MYMHLPIILEEKKMSNWIIKLFKKKNTSDIVRFIRTEYQSDVRQLRDEDVLAYYDYITQKKRSS